MSISKVRLAQIIKDAVNYRVDKILEEILDDIESLIESEENRREALKKAAARIKAAQEANMW